MTRTKLAIAAMVAWTGIILIAQALKGSSVGGPACRTDPNCGEVLWVPVLFWVAGLVVIGLVAWVLASRAKRQ